MLIEVQGHGGECSSLLVVLGAHCHLQMLLVIIGVEGVVVVELEERSHVTGCDIGIMFTFPCEITIICR